MAAGHTHQGGIAATHLQDYLDEFTFRFNRRTSRARGLLFFRLLEQAAATDPVRYPDLVVTPGTGNRNAHRSDGQRPSLRPWPRTALSVRGRAASIGPPSLIATRIGRSGSTA